MRVPSLAGIPLLETASSLSSGAAFETNTPAREDAVVVTDGWTVEVLKGNRVVVARGGAEANYGDAFRSGLLRAQQGLDLMAIQGMGDLSIRAYDDDHVVWWSERDALTIRVVSMAPFDIGVTGGRLSVRDASGQEVASPSEPPLSWDESFRYFRLAQTSDDLFDAYRNAYLALESVLSSITPQRVNAEGRVVEGEGVWFRRALEAADTVTPLSAHVPEGDVDPVQYLFDDLFVGMRSAMSHAKSGRKVLLPRNEADRQAVTESLMRLVHLYLGLAKDHLKARRGGGGMFPLGFRAMAEPALASVAVVASNDQSPFNRGDDVVNPGGGDVVEMTGATALDSTTSFLVTRLFVARARELARLRFVQRFAATDSSGRPSMTAVLQGPLVLGSATRLEFQLGIRGENVQQPRRRYSF